MSETNAPKPEIDTPAPTKPLEEVVTDVKSWQDALTVPVLFAGHGTASENPEDFFTDGIIIGGHDSLHETVIPLDTGSTDELKETLDHWPHLDRGHVVLVAAQSPHDYSLLGKIFDSAPGLWMDGLIQKTQKWGREVNHIPADWVKGVYDRKTGEVTLNPNFSGREITKQDMENSGGIRYILSQLGGSALDAMGGTDGEDLPDFSEPVQLSTPADEHEATMLW